MRVRTAQRNLVEARLSLTERKKTLSQLPEECIRTLTHALKCVCTPNLFCCSFKKNSAGCLCRTILIWMHFQLERELSVVLLSCKKPGCVSENAPGGQPHLDEGLAERNESASDISQDPAMEHKILAKTEALRERLKLWTRRLDEWVCIFDEMQRQCVICVVQFDLLEDNTED